MSVLLSAGAALYAFLVFDAAIGGTPQYGITFLDKRMCETIAKITARQNPALIIPKLSDAGSCIEVPATTCILPLPREPR